MENRWQELIELVDEQFEFPLRFRRRETGFGYFTKDISLSAILIGFIIGKRIRSRELSACYRLRISSNLVNSRIVHGYNRIPTYIASDIDLFGLITRELTISGNLVELHYRRNSKELFYLLYNLNKETPSIRNKKYHNILGIQMIKYKIF